MRSPAPTLIGSACSARDKATIELYDTRTRKISPIFLLEKSPPYWIGAMPVSPDGKWMLFPQIDGHSSNLMMIEGLQ